MALWVDRVHGKNGWGYIREHTTRLEKANAAEGIAIWREVAEHYDRLTTSHTAPN